MAFDKISIKSVKNGFILICTDIEYGDYEGDDTIYVEKSLQDVLDFITEHLNNRNTPKTNG